MNLFEFTNEHRRLYEGFAQDQKILTPVRLDALFEQFSDVPLEVYRSAVSAMLRENRMPSATAQHTIVERAHEEWRRRRTKRRDVEARDAFDRPLLEAPAEPDPPELAEALAEYYRLVRNGVSPAQAGELFRVIDYDFFADCAAAHGHLPFHHGEKTYGGSDG